MIPLGIAARISITTVNTFDKLDWANNQYDLKVEISNDSINYKLLGRQQILSVPYALNAGNGLPKGKSKGATPWLLEKTNLGAFSENSSLVHVLQLKCWEEYSTA